MKNLIKKIAIVLVVTIMIKDLPLQSYAIDYYTDGEEDELFDDSDTDDDYDDIDDEASDDDIDDEMLGDDIDDGDDSIDEDYIEEDGDGISDEPESVSSIDSDYELDSKEKVLIEAPEDVMMGEHSDIIASDSDTLLEGYIEEVAEDISGEEVEISIGEGDDSLSSSKSTPYEASPI